VNTNGVITTVAGLVTGGHISTGYSGDGGLATSAQLNGPGGVALDAVGDIFIADSVNSRIRKVDTNGIITTVAGNGTVGFLGDGGAATNAELASPLDVAVDSAGNLYIADYWNSVVRKVGTNGTISTVAGLVTNGVVAWGYSGDGGAATNAQLDAPSSLAMDAAGNLLIADSGNNRIRMVGTNGLITTVAGNGGGGYSGDGDYATNSSLSAPAGVAAGVSGDLFISDNGNNRIRRVDSNGIISTVAGSGNTGFSGDGGSATNADLNSAVGVAVDANGNLFIADGGNNRIRRVVNQEGVLVLRNMTTSDSGSYSVIVTGPSGSLTSSIVNVTVLNAPLISQTTRNHDGSMTLGFISQSGSTSVVFSATDLTSPITWQPIYTNSTGGTWQFTDTNTAGIPRKYYRLLMP
jgi:sugar lactone lactonase YvrE